MPRLNSMSEIALQLKIKFVPVYLFVVGSKIRPIINCSFVARSCSLMLLLLGVCCMLA